MIYSEKPADFSAKFELVICLIEVNREILLLQRQGNKEELGMWDVPNQQLNPNEDSDQIIVQKIFEETGHRLPIDPSAYRQTVYVRYPEHDFVCHIYHLKLPRKFPVKINPNTHQKGFWVKFWKIMSMPLARDLRASMEFCYKVGPTKFCERCGKNRKVSGGRFCFNCNHALKQEMAQKGYIKGKERPTIREEKDRKRSHSPEQLRGQVREDNYDDESRP